MNPRPFARLLRRLSAFLLIGVAFLLAACDAETPSRISGDESAPATPAGPSSPAAAPALPEPTPGPDGKVRLTEAEWRERLTPEQFKILRGSGTERPFSCPLWKISDEPGVYHCAGCGLGLFRSTDKFDSGTGWPSFTRPIASDRVTEHSDRSHGMVRVETLCARCDGHLGHVFTDGPPPSGLRYCINGTALLFLPDSPAEKAQP